MSETVLPVSAADLYSRLGTAHAPLVIDVRKTDAFSADDRMIVGALHRSPEWVDRWIAELPADRPIVAYCVHGHEVSQGVVRALREGGAKAAYLEGGIAGWKDRFLPTRKRSGTIDARWVTREHPKIDRIACPWLVSRFINPSAEFIYVPADEVLAAAEERNATPYDINGVQFGHVGDHCSFDAIIHHFEIKDPALDHLALIVRGADTSRAGSHAAMRRLARHIPWAVGELSGRSRNAETRNDHLRCALSMVPPGSGATRRRRTTA